MYVNPGWIPHCAGKFLKVEKNVHTIPNTRRWSWRCLYELVALVIQSFFPLLTPLSCWIRAFYFVRTLIPASTSFRWKFYFSSLSHLINEHSFMRLKPSLISVDRYSKWERKKRKEWKSNVKNLLLFLFSLNIWVSVVIYSFNYQAFIYAECADCR